MEMNRIGFTGLDAGVAAEVRSEIARSRTASVKGITEKLGTPQIVDAVADVLPGPVVAWLLGAIATLAAISAAISRVMAIPAVDAWLRKIGAGSTPSRFYVAQINGNATPLTRRQYRAMLDGADTGTDDTAKLRSAIAEHDDRIGL